MSAMRRLPILMIVAGAVLGIVGWVKYHGATTKYAKAKLDNAFATAYGNPFEDPNNAAQWVTAEHWGIGILCFGALVLLAGVAVLALRRA